MARPPLLRMAVLATLLQGCAAATLGGTGAETAALPQDMTGRWILAAPAAPTCGLHFTARGAGEGSVRPEGGCPGDFFLARSWQLAHGRLVLLAEDGTPLGTLEFSTNRFAGKDAAGVPITLARNSL